MKKFLSFTCQVWPLLVFLLVTLLFFWPVFNNKMPFPGDTLIGAYYPWREIKWEGRETEYPLKNMTLSDITGAILPWRYLAVNLMKKGELPLWNNYEFSGMPLLAAPETAALYPLNFLFFILPFNQAWTLLVILQPFLAGFFLYLFLRHKLISKTASLFGAISFAFGSYFLLTTEFNLLGHTILWLPLALLAVDKLLSRLNLFWFMILVFSLTNSLLAGFLQFSFYIFLLVIIYAVYNFFLKKNRSTIRAIFLVLASIIISLLISAVQIIPSLELIADSARLSAYSGHGSITDFFVPWQQLVMFLSPNFFGNPGTGNYWGRINYYEFCAYLGIPALFFILFLIFSKKYSKETLFWILTAIFSLILATPNFISILPYSLNVPFLSALVPARLLVITSFSLSILAAIGMDSFISDFNQKKRKSFKLFLMVSALLIFLFVLLWISTSFLPYLFTNGSGKELISRRNLILPTFLLLFTLTTPFFVYRKRQILPLVLLLLIGISYFDLFLQGRKFLTFFDTNLTYPETKTIEFLKNNLEYNRFLPLHQEIFGTNHQTIYGLESVEGFNPVHSRRYSDLISLTQPNTFMNFERTVVGRDYQANIFKLLSVKYFLSFEDLDDKINYPLVFQEGRVKIFENKKASPRIFLTCNWKRKNTLEEMVNNFINLDDPKETVFLEKDIDLSCQKNNSVEEVKITKYEQGKVSVTSQSSEDRILVFSDIYFPGWKSYVDDKEKDLLIVDYVLKGVIVPKGKHQVDFIYDPKSVKIGISLSVLSLSLLLLISAFLLIKSRKR